MNISRRNFLKGITGILAAGVAPAVVSNPMKIWVPPKNIITPIISIDLAPGSSYSVSAVVALCPDHHRLDAELFIFDGEKRMIKTFNNIPNSRFLRVVKNNDDFEIIGSDQLEKL